MYNFQPKFFNLFFLIVFEIKMLLNYTHGLLSLVELKRNLFKYTLSSIYAVYVYTKFHLHGIWVWSHSSDYALIVIVMFCLHDFPFTQFFLVNKKHVNGGESVLRPLQVPTVGVATYFTVMALILLSPRSGCDFVH